MENLLAGLAGLAGLFGMTQHPRTQKDFGSIGLERCS